MLNNSSTIFQFIADEEDLQHLRERLSDDNVQGFQELDDERQQKVLLEFLKRYFFSQFEDIDFECERSSLFTEIITPALVEQEEENFEDDRRYAGRMGSVTSIRPHNVYAMSDLISSELRHADEEAYYQDSWADRI